MSNMDCTIKISRLFFLQEFNISHVGPVIELYESDCIRYITPIENNEGFFVPEVAKHQTTETKKGV